MDFKFTLETNATSRVEGLNYALGNISDATLVRLFIELEKRLHNQKHASGVDVYLHSQRLASEIRSDSCHVFGELRPLLASVCTPYVVTKIAKQMEFAQSYECTVFNSFEEAFVELLKVEQQKVSHHSLVNISAEVQATSEANTISAVPGGKASLEFVVDDYVDLNCVNSSELEKIILASCQSTSRTFG